MSEHSPNRSEKGVKRGKGMSVVMPPLLYALLCQLCPHQRHGPLSRDHQEHRTGHACALGGTAATSWPRLVLGGRS
jgi:hypothetical protein